MKGEKFEKNPVVYIMPLAKEKLDLYVEVANGEISGIGKVERIDGKLVITDILLFEQESSYSRTRLDQAPIHAILQVMAERNEDPSVFRLWWHSHASMDTFWSNTDDDTMEGLAQEEWMLSLVQNKKGEYKLCFLLYSPLRLAIDDLKLEIWKPENTELRREIEEEVKAKVRITPVYQQPYRPVSAPASGDNRYVTGAAYEGGWSEWDQYFQGKETPAQVEKNLPDTSVPKEGEELTDGNLLETD